MQKPMNILSIQSWVSYGHAGNASAVFALQRMGFEVWAIHTVQFSNHTGYGAWKGMVLPSEHVLEVVQGIKEREVLQECNAVLSGYMGSADTAGVILEAVAEVRKANPSAIYCCDPVMGDVGRGIFVRPEIPDAMRDRVVPQANILTPNQFELELLTKRTVSNLETAIEAANILRARMQPEAIVIVTSFERIDAQPDTIEVLAVSSQGVWLVTTPKIPLDPPRNGTGDCIAALLLGHYLKTGKLETALENATSALHNLLELTHQMGTREIQLIAAQDEYIAPSKLFSARKI
jgi:pyridoxine kinase